MKIELNPDRKPQVYLDHSGELLLRYVLRLECTWQAWWKDYCSQECCDKDCPPTF